MVLLWGGFSEHGGQSVFCTDLIRSKSGLFSQDFVSSLRRLTAPFLCVVADCRIAAYALSGPPVSAF
ncbi:hypothetical protein XL92_001549 [Salmonella enterica subsp. enterica]|nr:hypothetical protein [Salmonella enterica subsp. enterica]